MHYTIFDTPIIRTLTRWLALFWLKMLGWRAEGEVPDVPKYVIIAAPHTSNWDFVYTLLVSFALRLNVRVMLKKEMFRWPLGYMFRWLSAIPVDRDKSNNVVDYMVSTFHARDTLALVISPAGTRKKVMYWKSGFYHIANGAKVPIVLGYIDYRRKLGGIGPAIMPSGNIDKDMTVIRAFYADIGAKYPEKAIDKPKKAVLS
ncbi:glycerol acyltransferase [Desulfonema ishimotonii]|uniref:Glycerol acyltransferase n=1 Tax=Desulfonema ishimotonii TaxID=45657 RepID=A0A401G3B2_9BACT|nr:lysophospholipid acyltransferase family protein [Desulfonema ishimotonii]GBC63732.1 glycerol acyltransferase [Desulfonema ishimotonii]